MLLTLKGSAGRKIMAMAILAYTIRFGIKVRKKKKAASRGLNTRHRELALLRKDLKQLKLQFKST